MKVRTMTRRLAVGFGAAGALLLSGCPGEDETPAGADTAEDVAQAGDAESTDVGPDTNDHDVAGPDAPEDVAVAPEDLSQDAGPEDVDSDADLSGSDGEVDVEDGAHDADLPSIPEATIGEDCGDYMDMGRFIVVCDGAYTYGADYIHLGGATEECPNYVGLKGGRYASVEDATAATGCDGGCVNYATRSVSAVYCRDDCATFQRYGWIEFMADDCPTLYELPGGIFLSVEDWFSGRTDVCPDGQEACSAEPEPIDPRVP